MHSSGNLVNILDLVRSWILEKNLLLPLYQTSIVPDYIPKPVLIPTDKCSSYSSSKKFLFTAKGTTTDSQLDTIQESTDRGKPCPSGKVINKTSAHKTQRTWQEKGQKDCGKTLSPRISYLNKTLTVATSTDKLTWKGESLMKSLPR